jgi:hypothetical protein
MQHTPVRRPTRRAVRERADWLAAESRRDVRIALVRAVRRVVGKLSDRQRRAPVVILVCRRLTDASIEALVELRMRPGMDRFPTLRATLTWFDAWELERLLREAA